MQIPTELILDVASLSMIVGYHLFLWRQLKKHPNKTSYGLIDRMRKPWISAIMESKQGILAIQTLRNWTMASSLA